MEHASDAQLVRFVCSHQQSSDVRLAAAMSILCKQHVLKRAFSIHQFVNFPVDSEYGVAHL